MARFLLAALHPAEADVAEVLDPFEVGDGHTAGIGVHVGDDHRALLAQDVVGARRDGTVRRLDDKRRLDPGRVFHRDDPFERGGDEDVALLLQHGGALGRMARVGEALHPAMLDDPVTHGLHVHAVRIEKRTVPLDDAGDDRAVFLLQELGGVVAHIAQALDDHTLAVERARQPRLGLVLGVAEEFAQGVLHPAARRFHPAGNAAGIERLARHAGAGIDIGGVHPVVLIGHPRHFALARAHVGGGHVLGGVDQVALDQLVGEAAGDLLHLVLVPFAGVDAKAALGAAEGRLDQRAFVGHQRGQRLHLVLVDARGVADAALDRLHVLGMHRAIAHEGMDLSAQANPEADGVGGIADPDLFLEAGGKIHQRHGAVEHQIDALAERRLLDRWHGFLPVRVNNSLHLSTIISTNLCRVRGRNRLQPLRIGVFLRFSKGLSFDRSPSGANTGHNRAAFPATETGCWIAP